MKALFYPGADCIIRSERIFQFPVDYVYKAWTDPEHLKNWWGPNGFTNTFHKHELKPDGEWRFTMHGPDGGNFENECRFIVIEENHFLAWYRLSKPIFQVQVTFEAVSPAATNIIFKMVFDDAVLCRKIALFAVEKNEENFDRLEVELTKIIMNT